MKTSIRSLAVATLLTLPLSLSGCGGKVDVAGKAAPEDGVAINCIAVLPTTTKVDYDKAVTYGKAQGLEKGAEVLRGLLGAFFKGEDQIRFISANQLEGLVDATANTPTELARMAGHKAGCNAALETRVDRFNQRVGGELSADAPASVAFSYRLIEVGEGRVLCHGEFDESQQSVMENLFTFNKASSRGFDWITAEQLMSEGLGERFADCPYLAPGK